MLPRRSGSGAGVCGFTGRREGFVGWASSPFTNGMRAVRRAWPLGRGTIEDVSTTFPPGRLRGHELLAAVAEGTAGAVGDEFLRCLAQHVAEAFAAKMVLICEADDPSGMHVRDARQLVRRRVHRGAVRVRHRGHAVRGHDRLSVGRVPGGAERALPEGRDRDQPRAAELRRGVPEVVGRRAPRPPRGARHAPDGGGRGGRRGAADLRRARVRGARAPQPGAGAGRLAGAGDRGGRQGAPPRRARPARRRPAAAAGGLEPAAGVANEARRGRPRARPRGARRGGARAGARRAAQARPRAAPGGAARARARAGAGVAVPGVRRPDRRRRLRGRAAAAGRARAPTSSPRRRSPTPRATRRRARSTCGSRRTASGWWSRCGTTASAAPTSRRGPGCWAWPTASTCSAAASRSTAPPVAARPSVRRFHCDRPPALHRLRRGEHAARRGPVRAARRLRARPAGDGAEGVRGPARAARAARHARAGAGRDGAARGPLPRAPGDPPLPRLDGEARATCSRRTSRSATTATRRGCGPTRPRPRSSRRTSRRCRASAR